MKSSSASIHLFNMLCMTAMMVFVPVIGPLIRELGLAEWHGGLIVTISGVFWMLLARFWGRRSDRFGRKPILLLAGIGFSLSYLLLAGLLDYALKTPLSLFALLLMMILFRGLMGVFFAGVPPVCAAQIADTHPPDERAPAMAKLGASGALGMVFGPLLAGVLAQYTDLVMPLYLAAVLPLLAVGLLAWMLPGTTPVENQQSPRVKLMDHRIRLPLLAMFLAMGSVIISQMTVGFYALDRLHLDALQAARMAGLAMTGVGVTLILVQVVLSKAKQVNSLKVLLWGALLACGGFLLVTLWISQAGLLVSYCIMAAGLGLVFPSVQALTANSVESHEQGTAAGTLAAVQGLAMVIMPLICTLFYEINPILPYLIAAALLLLLSIGFAVYRPLVKQPDEVPVNS
ncbi:MFS transporter [Oceanospirillum linum]|uniref:MFS transporter n=1 Tax=Oceanospirillum linum TaxID=966 RepID=A0A1T1H8G8_OCELI|nr:MFS transporter [Oceanospirillum linum]OOV86007.1 MFS transporter [Oceanospirillum linum]SEG43979.1 Predicted arabinose efflux permease, MFS family [Oleiphilus messinensis]SMP34228.1 Predicted arabinose efflux permease, MFS family [Oceanospirillum linum]